MKKILPILMLLFVCCFVLFSCKNNESPNSNTETKSLYELAVEAGFEGTLEEWGEAVANSNTETKSLYELAVEAGFEGTLEEWGEAVANSKNLISSADAIIIAQTHFFAVYSDEYPCYSDMATVALLSNEDSENWYIHIAPEDVIGDLNVDYKGGSHLYTISKKTGNIVNIKFGGE